MKPAPFWPSLPSILLNAAKQSAGPFDVNAQQVADHAALMQAAPAMREALSDIAADGPYSDSSGDDESIDDWLARQGEDGLREHIAFLRDKARALLATLPQ